MVNDKTLFSKDATSIISKDVLKKELSNFQVYTYLSNNLYDEEENKFYLIEDSEILLLNGLLSFENKSHPSDIKKLFNQIPDEEIIGDYQAIYLNNDGEGFIKTPQSSIYPLFYYEDKYMTVISNELKLITDGLKIFKDNKFVDFYDIEYIRDLVKFGDNKKTTLRNTIFKNIKRILPQDKIKIEKGKINISEVNEIRVPDWFENWFLEDRSSLYDWYYETLLNYTESFINDVKNNLDEIVMGITGGFDSRLTLLILEKICSKYNISLKTQTEGLSEHPDVVIGSRVASQLNVEWEHLTADDESYLKSLPHHFNEYATTFFQSQGDFNSYDYVPDWSREITSSSSFYQHGMDMYKRDSFASVVKFNRWFSRRVLFRYNFYLPLLGTKYELWFAELYNKHYQNQKQYTEFVYEILKRGNPELLEIPFAFDYLPQTNVKEFKVDNYQSTNHKVEPFLWDYHFVLNELSSLIDPEFNENDRKNDSILSEIGITSLDYFLLKDDIDKILNKNITSEKKNKEIIKLRNNSFYTPYRCEINLDEVKHYYKTWALLKLMDFAVAADYNSFNQLEKSCSFYENSKKTTLDLKEEIYSKFEQLEYENLKLTEKYNKSLQKNKKLNRMNKKLKQNNKELINSTSWKLTEPLRKIKNKLNDR